MHGEFTVCGKIGPGQSAQFFWHTASVPGMAKRMTSNIYGALRSPQMLGGPPTARDGPSPGRAMDGIAPGGSNAADDGLSTAPK